MGKIISTHVYNLHNNMKLKKWLTLEARSFLQLIFYWCSVWSVYYLGKHLNVMTFSMYSAFVAKVYSISWKILSKNISNFARNIKIPKECLWLLDELCTLAQWHKCGVKQQICALFKKLWGLKCIFEPYSFWLLKKCHFIRHSENEGSTWDHQKHQPKSVKLDERTSRGPGWG